MIVHFKIDLPRIQNTKEAHKFCQLLADEIVQSSANSENDIKSIQYSVPKERMHP
jgi:hypothetical protein